jgi:uncharacterized protein (TIGR02246 family)
MRKLILLPLLLFAAFGANAQPGDLTLEKGVAAHAEIDAIYKTFSDAYRTLDVEKVASLYSETAAYLAPENDILQGRAAIRPTFASFFDWVKKENRTMTISFRIVQRRVDKNLGYDVGIYSIRQYKDGKQVGDAGEGKFITIAVREKDGKWCFQVDGYSNLKPSKKQ